MIKVLVTGDRNWTYPPITHRDFVSRMDTWIMRRQTVREAIEQLELDYQTALSDILIIQGGARGVDSLACDISKDLGCQTRTYPALWDVYGKGAGPLRNREMLDKNPDIVKCLAFHDDIVGKSKGTLHMARYAKSKGVPVIVYRSNGSYFNFVIPNSSSRFGAL